MYCQKCGTQIPDDSAFCMKCGQPQRMNTTVQHQSAAMEYCSTEITFGPNRSFFSRMKLMITVRYAGGPTHYFVAYFRHRSQREEEETPRRFGDLLRSELGKAGWIAAATGYMRPSQLGRAIDEPRLVIPGMEETSNSRFLDGW
jgi:zinc-ribbon domain